MGEAYYLIDEKDLFKKLKSSENGLTSNEADVRKKEFGLNIIKEKDKRTGLSIFLSQFKSPFILVLLFAAIIAFFLLEITDGLIIVAIILISSILGFYQEYKSEKALQALKKYISFNTKVLRDGEKKEVDVKELVPGDIVFLKLGDIVPADIRILDSGKIYANESVITGESYPVIKYSQAIKSKNLPITKQANMLFMGSIISGGFGKGIVVSTGENTQFGKTATLLGSKEPPSDFQKGIKKFGVFLLKIVLILTIFVFAVNFFLGKGPFSSFLFALALAVGITPELLPIIITISMSRGAIRMAEKKVIIKKLSSIEDLGNMDILCTDKTGTLTENKVAIEDYFDFNGKKPKEIIEYALICNSVEEKNYTKGDIIDSAIWRYAKEGKINLREHTKIEDIEFDYDRKRMSSIAEVKGRRIIICKGNPLSILDVCKYLDKNKNIVPIANYRKRLNEKYEDLSKKGLRVIAVSYKEVGDKKSYNINDEKDLIFLGFICLFDPPKKYSEQALKKLNDLGIKIKILTGDNEFVTEYTCKKVGFKVKGKILTGEYLERMNEADFLRAIEENNVFARINPELKFKIVSCLIKKGFITGFLGDGVNDAPALKSADIGITVDGAVDVAKESADVILLQKNLEVLADGVNEGRKTFGNTTKYILNTTSANFGNMFTLSISSLYFKFLPLLPSQILLGNFVSDIPLATISADNVDKSYLKKPKHWNLKMISKFMVFFGLISSIFDVLTMALVWFFLAPNNPDMFRTVWFTESVLSEMIITFSIRTKGVFWKSKPSKILMGISILSVILTMAFIFTPLSGLFKFERLSWFILAVIFLILCGYLFITEIGKRIFYNLIYKEE